MLVKKITFDSFADSVEMTAKVCTDAPVKNDPGFPPKLWKMKHRTPFEHNTFRLKDRRRGSYYHKMNRHLRTTISMMKTHGIYNPAFRVDKDGLVMGSFRAWAELLELQRLTYDGLLDILEPCEGRVTFYVETNIGISREMMRHRAFGFTERSTRYTKEHRADTTVMPDGDYLTLEGSIEYYQELKDSGLKNDWAREVLPLGLATAFYMTGWPDQFPHMLDLRQAKAAHPAMQEVAEAIAGLC